MALTQIVPNLYCLSLGPVNSFIISEADGLSLIDTGFSGSEAAIFSAIHQLGKQPSDLRRIILTHCHPDHAGAAAAVQKATGAPLYAPTLEAAQIRAGHVDRRLIPTPRPLQRILYWFFIRNASPDYPPAIVDHEIEPDTDLPFAGGLRAIAAPGHSDGQLVYLWPKHGGVLFAADTCANMPTLDYSLGYDDFALGQRTLVHISQLDFAVACFGHGKSILQDAAHRFRRRWRKLIHAFQNKERSVARELI
jgi:glyoxylase-like metal-dependent hydrolase (beta-lactamase superfamily II)